MVGVRWCRVTMVCVPLFNHFANPPTVLLRCSHCVVRCLLSVIILCAQARSIVSFEQALRSISLYSFATAAPYIVQPYSPYHPLPPFLSLSHRTLTKPPNSFSFLTLMSFYMHATGSAR